ncbi:MAG: response regulator [Planctomycetota bacterium]|jgi:DNA-binding response OmpR family regulator
MEKPRLLIVDDEEDLTGTLAERLEMRGFQVRTALSGVDALRLIGSDDFDVFILDVKLPGITGLELMAEIKREYPERPVILFTGHGSETDARRGMARGAFDYLMKPVDIEELVKKIRNAIAGERPES